MMPNAKFLAEAKTFNRDVRPRSGKTMIELLTELYAMPKSVIEKALVVAK